MNPGKEEYKELVEQFRHYYLTKFGIKLEDDMIYLFIRINEMHLDLKKEIANIKRQSFGGMLKSYFNKIVRGLRKAA